MNILKLEKRGCDFSENDLAVAASDIGNHRLCTPGFTVPAKNGKAYFLEFTHGNKWRTRTTNKRNGKPLKHPVRELVAHGIAFCDACYEDADGCCWRDNALWRAAYNEPRPYTEAGILDIVNSFAAEHYDRIEYVR
jgi:hypothetical protein